MGSTPVVTPRTPSKPMDGPVESLRRRYAHHNTPVDVYRTTILRLGVFFITLPPRRIHESLVQHFETWGEKGQAGQRQYLTWAIDYTNALSHALGDVFALIDSTFKDLDLSFAVCLNSFPSASSRLTSCTH